MEAKEIKKRTETRGGKRPGAGRPPTDSKTICVRIDQEAHEILSKIKRKGEYVSEAVKKLHSNE